MLDRGGGIQILEMTVAWKGECMFTASMVTLKLSQSTDENNKESNAADKSPNSGKSSTTSNKTCRVMLVYRNRKMGLF